MPTYPTYKLGDVAEIINGKNQKEVVSPQGKYPIYGSGGIIGWATDYLCKENSTIIGRKGTIDSPIFVNRKFWNVDTAFGIQPSEKVLPRYLFFFCKSFDFKKLDKSTTIPSLAKRDLLQISIPLPPLPTQQAIVTRIESLFAELDKAVQHLRTAQQQLKIYRQAVLNHWLNNDDGKWEMVKLGDVADVNTGSTPKRGNKEYWENGTIPWITSGETNNQYITKATEFITTKAVAETNCKIIAKGSLVIAMYGEGKTRGKCAELSIDATTNQALASITFTDSRMYKNFAKWFFEKNYEDMRMLSSGGVQPNLNLGIIKNMILPLPPLTEQQRIVKEIESRLSQATASETCIENALQQAEALRQSILKKAFGGELV